MDLLKKMFKCPPCIAPMAPKWHMLTLCFNLDLNPASAFVLSLVHFP